MVLAISQSGETADTLAAMEEGRQKGARAVVDRQRDRLAGDAHSRWVCVDADGTGDRRGIHQGVHRAAGRPVHAGDSVGRSARVLDEKKRRRLVNDLRLVPDLAGRCLDREARGAKVARALMDTETRIYLGRGINMPIAYEGALKLKEISYIHAEGYPAGEMKHGPIALVDREMPVIVIAPRDPWYEKMLSQMEQAKARGRHGRRRWRRMAMSRPRAWRTMCCGCPRRPGCSAR